MLSSQFEYPYVRTLTLRFRRIATDEGARVLTRASGSSARNI